MTPIKCAWLLLFLMVPPGAVHAQGVGSSGDIAGTISDPSGAGIPKATIIAMEIDKGIQHATETDMKGEYRLAGLPPAVYDLTVRIAGFQTKIQKVILTVGATVVVDSRLKLAAASEIVEVTAEPPAVDAKQTGQAETVNQGDLVQLPIDIHRALDFCQLMPGVSDSNRLASDVDPRAKQTPQSGMSIYGSNGRGNAVTVDGAEANDNTGGVRLTVSQDAVQEFQINRSNYGAELGGASGATINIVTKSGSNQLHSSLYGFFRNDSMDARNPFSFSQALEPGDPFIPGDPDREGQPVKDSLDRQQFGATVGFPLRKNKTFLFAAFEGLRRDAQNAVPLLTNTSIFRPETNSGNNQAAILTGPDGLANLPGDPTVPCLSGPVGAAVATSLGLPPPNPTTNLPAHTCAAVLNGTLTLNPARPLSAFLIDQFETNGGLFDFTTRTYLASGRLDHHFNDSNQLTVNYRFAHDREENPDVQSLTGFSRGSAVHNYDHNLQASWFHEFSPRTRNEARVQWNYYSFDVIPNEPGQVGLDIPGFASLGTNIFLPSLTIGRRYELADNLAVIRGRHTMKFGGYFLYRGDHTESHTFFPGRFVFGSLPGNLLSPCLASPAACQLTGPNPAAINSLQSAAFGLPQFYQQGFDNPVYNYPRPFIAGFWQDSWEILPSLTLNYGVRYELDKQHGPLNTDTNNFAPRVAFAWRPSKDQKTVVRGGYGIFYSQIYGQIPDVVQTLGVVDPSGRPVTNLAECSAGADACFRQIAQVFVPLTGAPGNPSLTSAAIFQTLFAQGKVQCTTPAAGAAACITPADLTQFGVAITHTGPIPPLTALFSGQPDYRNAYSQQAELGIEREIAKGWSVSANYIYAHTVGLPVALDINNLEILNLPEAQQFVPAGPAGIPIRQWGASNANCANPFNCFANPLLLQNNQYSSAGSAVYHGAIFKVERRFRNHLGLIGSYTFSKAIDQVTDFNSDFGPMDQANLAGERSLSSFDQRHKVVLAAVMEAPWNNRFLSGFQIAPIVRYNSSHPINLLAGTNVNNDRHSTNDRPPGAGRNTGMGPDYITFDMRLSRQFKLTEKASAQLIAEGFNVFNRTNFASVNSVVGVIGPPFDLSGTQAASPSQPLGFTSAFTKREIQLGIRVSF